MEFSAIERDVYNIMCLAAQKITAKILEEEDERILHERDKNKYRSKGLRKTTVKTIYGDVNYMRRLYLDNTGKGVYLLDEELRTKTDGSFSENIVEAMLNLVTVNSYRSAAEAINKTTGTNVSHTAIWNIVSNIGSDISKSEEVQTSEEYDENKKDVKVLFEEMDGVWLSMQDKNHKKTKKQELKVATIYEGWDAETGKHLVGKTLVAGMEPAAEFIRKKENAINKAYNIDEIEYRILNGDGGKWIKDDADNVIFQLDRFHIMQEINRKIEDKRAAKRIKTLFRQEKIDEMLEYITIYADSVDTNDSTDAKANKARELYSYLYNNRGGLLPYQSSKRNVSLAEAPEGIVYKGMGVQENQNCSLITLRMKSGRMRWSVDGANAMAKVLTAKSNGYLYDFIAKRYATPQVASLKHPTHIAEMSAAKVPAKAGKGCHYIDIINAAMPILDNSSSHTTKLLRRLIAG